MISNDFRDQKAIKSDYSISTSKSVQPPATIVIIPKIAETCPQLDWGRGKKCRETNPFYFPANHRGKVAHSRASRGGAG